MPPSSSSLSSVSTSWLASPRPRLWSLRRHALLERGENGGRCSIHRCQGPGHRLPQSRLGRQAPLCASAAGGAESIEDKEKGGSSNVSRPEHREQNREFKVKSTRAHTQCKCMCMLVQGQSPSPLPSSPNTAALSEEEANKKRKEESKEAGTPERQRRRPPRGEERGG